MSTCISQHGEFSAHESSPDSLWYCRLCGEHDQTGLLAALKKAEAKVARVEALAEEWRNAANRVEPYEPNTAGWLRWGAREIGVTLAESGRDEEGR